VPSAPSVPFVPSAFSVPSTTHAQMDSRKTFKLFQDAQRAAHRATTQLEETKRAFYAELHDTRAAYEAKLGLTTAQA
jgi:hypothetical protein